jgi:hypothetical protein
MKNILGGLFLAGMLFGTFMQPHSASAAQLDDGFYKSKGKYYYVVNGHRARVKKGNTYRTLLRVAQKGGYTPISEADYQAIETRVCDFDNPFYRLDPTLRPACEARLKIGAQLRERLEGKMLVRVEDNGQLSYITKKTNATYPAVPVGKRFFERTFFQYAKKQSIKVKRKQIRKLTKWRTVDSLR